MNPTRRLNDLLDELTALRTGRPGASPFKSLGVGGFHAAAIATFAGGIFGHASLPALALAAAVCAGSFYAWTHARRRIVGREELVLFELVWLALAAAAGALALVGQPVLLHLDVVAVGMSVFLAFGRVGCLLVGCCHGRPAPLGVAYGAAQVREGLPGYLEGVRLFPVAGVEALGLAAIGAIGLCALPLARPGDVLAWFLGAYALLRFATEGLRGDRRPHLAGLSIGRWMALAQLGAALALRGSSLAPTGRERAVLVGLIAVASFAGALKLTLQPRRRLLARRHLDELRDRVRVAQAEGPRAPTLVTTSRGVRLVVSAAAGRPDAWYVSLRLPTGLSALDVLCALAARAFPHLRADAAEILSGEIVMFEVAKLSDGGAAARGGVLEHALYFDLVRRLQARAPAAPVDDEPAIAPADEATVSTSDREGVSFASIPIMPRAAAARATSRTPR